MDELKLIKILAELQDKREGKTDKEKEFIKKKIVFFKSFIPDDKKKEFNEKLRKYRAEN